ncbi:aminoglycoside phosphotransferase family protein [Phenylobacterium sp. LjRoot225]|uniref:aminoglycoside phosphotransferase family protein n=1 Tax=Phenylobacterium sp. LjRoot225 TaxID=3342285 RepID=UPI003ECFFF34
MPALEVPHTLAQALDAAWLTKALTPLTGGATVTGVETVEVIKTVATKVRFTAAYDGAPDGKGAFCLKGFLDVDPEMAKGGATTVLEADYYDKFAEKLSVRVPDCVATVVDREAPLGVIIMRDLIAQGARFCSALEAFTADEAAESLGQLAALHAGRTLLEEAPWVRRRVAELAKAQYVPQPLLQEMLNGPRGEGLPARTRDAALLIEGMKALAAEDEKTPDVLVHGDSHAGNIFRTAAGPGLIDWQLLQRGGWALDVAYHIAAVLPVEVAEREERALLGRYLETARGLGCETPDPETAWAQYRIAAVYGYYLWSITRRVDPAIINVFVGRLGASVTRHESYRLLGL